jgi:hypothetical protein
MKPIEELENYFKSNGVKEADLLMCGKYISLYLKELYSIYSIDATNKEHNITCKILSQAMMEIMVEFQQLDNISLETQVHDVISDFESDSKKGIGNLLPLLDRAERHEETTTRIITELSDIFIPEDHQFPTKSDLTE